MKSFNRLTPNEAERLAILAEECGEAIQIIGKILRHGYESWHPKDSAKRSNRSLLERELGDINWIVEWMCEPEQSDLNKINIEYFRNMKNLKIGEYLHHQK